MFRKKIIGWIERYADGIKDDLRGVAIEFIVIALFASMPFWLGVCIFGIVREIQQQPWDWGQALLSTLSKGELLIFSVTFLSPMFWTVSLDPTGGKAFPGRGLWIAIVFLFLVGTASFFAIWRAFGYIAAYYSPLVRLSLGLAVAALTLRLIIMALHQRRLPSPENMFNEPTNDFAESYAQTRGQDEHA